MRNAREIIRVHVILSVNNGEKTKKISEKLDVHRNTIMQIKKRYLEGALNDNPRTGQPKKI